MMDMAAIIDSLASVITTNSSRGRLSFLISFPETSSERRFEYILGEMRSCNARQADSYTKDRIHVSPAGTSRHQRQIESPASGVDLHNRTSVSRCAHANTRPLRSSNAAATVVRRTAVETSDRQPANRRRVASSFTGRSPQRPCRPTCREFSD